MGIIVIYCVLHFFLLFLITICFWLFFVYAMTYAYTTGLPMDIEWTAVI